MRRFSLGLGAALIASFGTTLLSVGVAPPEHRPPQKKRTHLQNYGEPVVDTTKESKRARRRRLAREGR